MGRKGNGMAWEKMRLEQIFKAILHWQFTHDSEQAQYPLAEVFSIRSALRAG